MTAYEIFCLIALIVTHAAMYMLGRATVFEPSDEAWVEVKKHTINKQIEYWKWLEERKTKHAEKTEGAAECGD